MNPTAKYKIIRKKYQKYKTTVNSSIKFEQFNILIDTNLS